MKGALGGSLALLLVCFSTLLQAADLSGAYKAMRMGNFNEAAGIFASAAADGAVEAQYQLGKLYLVGRGVRKMRRWRATGWKRLPGKMKLTHSTRSHYCCWEMAKQNKPGPG
jgi:hypothetical protein